MGVYVGLDVSLASVAICVIDEDGRVLWEGKAAGDPEAVRVKLEPWLGKIERLGLEAGPTSEWIGGQLLAAGFQVACLETRHVKAALSAMVVKTDRNDARGIAQIVRAGWVADDLALAAIIQPLLHAHERLVAETAQLHRLVLQTVRADPICRRLMTMPGIGPVTALTFRATIDDPHRFRRSRSVGAYLGLTPRRHQSGEIDRVGRISKVGDGETRTALFEAANVVLRPSTRWSAMKAWAMRIAGRQGSRRAKVALARRMAVTLHRMWIDDENFRWTSAAA